MFIKNMFRKQSRFEKYLFDSSIFDSSETVDLDDIKAMLQGMFCLIIGYPSKEEEDQLVQSMTIVQIFREFIRLIPMQMDAHKKLKVLLTFHVLMGDVKHGRLFVTQLLGWTAFQQAQDTSLFSKFANIHSMVIQKLAVISEILLKSKLKTNIDSLYVEGSVMQFYKMINCLNFILAQQELFAQVIQAHNRVIVMEVYLLLWNDVIALYLQLERFIRQFMDCYQQLDCKQSIQVYELFNEYIKLTTQVRKFASLSSKFKNCGINEPKWYVPQKKEIEELQLYFQNVKIHMTSRSKRQKLEKSASQLILGRLCQTSDREARKNNSQLAQKSDRDKSKDQYLSNTTLGYIKKLSQATNPTQALQYTFESDQRDIM